VTYAAFSKTTSNPGSVVSARPDWRPPAVSATTIKKTTGYSTGYVRQGGTYHVYANVSEPASNPAAGVASVNADASVLTAGQTAVPLTTTGGPWTVEGVSYNYRSAQLTAAGSIPEGLKSWSLTAVDLATPTANSTGALGYNATVDNTAPAVSAMAGTNKAGGTQSLVEVDDVLTLTVSEQLDPDSFAPGWSGAGTRNITVRISNGTGGTNDIITFYDVTNTTQLALGQVFLGRNDYVSVASTFGGPGAATHTRMTQAAGVLTITLGSQTAGTVGTAGNTANMRWTPSGSAFDRAGNAMPTTQITEAAPLDRDF
jgi:hypothetical protein